MNRNYTSFVTNTNCWHQKSTNEAMKRPSHRRKTFSNIWSTLLLIILFGGLLRSNAQSTANYAFTTNTTSSLVADANANVVDMTTGTTLLVTDSSDDIPSSVTNIGFNFIFMGNLFTQFSASSNGIMQLGGTAVAGVTYIASGGSLLSPKLSAFGGDLQTGSLGRVHSKLVGTAPNRCLVVEFLNMNLYYAPSTFTNDATYQVRLYESTGVVEYVYGAMAVSKIDAPPADITPSIGFSVGSATNTFGSVTFAAHTYNTTTTFTENPSSTVGTIAALNSTANGSRRAYVFTPPLSTVPNSPTVLTFSAIGSGSTAVNWVDNSTNETGFLVTRATDAAFTTGVVITLVLSTTAVGTGASYSSLQTGLVNSTLYFYRIQSSTEISASIGLTGSQSTTPPNNITSTATGGNWSATSTWSGGIVPTSVDNVTIADGTTVTVDVATATCNNLTVGQGTSGILQYLAATFSSLVVGADVTVASGGNFTAGSGTLFTHTLSIAGNLVNNGTFDLNTTAGVTTTFTGAADRSISGSGTTCDFFAIIVNKGTSTTPILDVTRVITMSTVSTSTNRLILTNGTFRLSSASTITPIGGTQTICASTGRLWLNNAGASYNSGSAGSPTVSGVLQLDAGTFNYGTGNNALAANGTIQIGGGTLNMLGTVAFGSSATFTMTSGNFNVDPQATNSATAGDVFNIASGTIVNFTGGTLTIVDSNASNATAANTEFEVAGTTGSKNFIGSTIRFGDGTSTTSGNATNLGFSISIPATVTLGTVIINNPSGTNRQVRISSTISNECTITNLTVTVGTLNLNGQRINIVGAGAALTNTGTIDGTVTNSRLNFIGTSAQSFTNGGTITAPLAGMGISNAAGFTLNSPITTLRVNLFSGTVTNSSNITIGNSGTTSGTIQVGGNSGTVNPGSFDGVPIFNLGTGGLTVRYDAGNAVTTGFEIPPTRVVASVVINNANGVTLSGGNLTLSTGTAPTLTMTVGNFNIGANNLTLGASATTPGVLSYTAGFINATTGTFKRWYPITGLPIAAGISIGYYPFGDGTNNRQAQVFFSTATALSAGGTITVGHDSTAGLTSITGFNDGGVTVDRRSNANWTVSVADGITLSGAGTVSLSTRGDNILPVINFTGLRMIRAADAVGTSANGTGSNAAPVINRTGLNIATIANTFYMGGAPASAALIYTAIANGNWGDSGTWDLPGSPGATDNVIIPSTFNVTVNGVVAPYQCNGLTINSGGTLTANASSLAVNSNIINNGALALGGGTVNVTGTLANSGIATVTGGTVNVRATSGTGITNSATTGSFAISGGTVNLGITDNSFCNRTFTNNGTLSVSLTGTLNINGNLNVLAGSTFNQSGGDISVDGNAGGAAASSVASGISIVQLNSQFINWTGGTLTIIDPHANSTASNSFAYNNSTAHVNVTAGHTIRFGNGISTDAGGNATNGFRIDTYTGSNRISFFNLEVNGGTGTNRFVSSTYNIGINGNLSINANSELRDTGNTLIVSRDIINNGTLTSTGILTFGTFLNGTSGAANTSQSVSGAGVFRNLVTSPTHNFTSLIMNNANGVTFASNNVTVSDGLTVNGASVINFASGKNLILGGTVTVAASSTLTFENNSNLIQTGTSANSGNIIVKRNTSMKRLDYTYWSSPVAAQNVMVFSPGTLPNRFYTFSETTNAFVPIAATTTFEAARGYAIRAPDAHPTTNTAWTGTFTGVPNNGTVPFTATITAPAAGSNGYNLIGNPYPSTVSGGAFIAANPGSLNFWTHSVYQGGVTNYATYTSAGGTAAALGGPAPNGIIQVGQGFIYLPATAGSKSFTNAMRVADNNDQFYRTSNSTQVVNEFDKYWLNATGTNNQFSQILVGYFPNGTNNFDGGLDGKQINSEGAVLSSLIGGEAMAIQGRGNFVSSDTVPLGFKANTAGNYTLAIDHKEGLFNNGQNIFLKDNLTGTLTNLQNNDYNFVSDAGTFNNRFEIVYESTLSNNNNTFNSSNVVVFNNNNQLNINATLEMTNVKVFDMRGRAIFEKKAINSKATVLEGFAPQQQVLIVQITDNENRTVTKKVIF
jgi:hypothetical protein